MLDAANYKMHSKIVDKFKSCQDCRKMGKNLQTLSPKTSISKYPEPEAPNNELQLDFAGPLFGNLNKIIYMLASIDSYSG